MVIICGVQSYQMVSFPCLRLPEESWASGYLIISCFRWRKVTSHEALGCPSRVTTILDANVEIMNLQWAYPDA
ncbi:hypothetical protein PAXRUDRAFT_568430 [Paxillus rubicundulus Ve08.2h10]|uniref:Uncharacterized protein n=1 Tax=Paxillus rubicundulus Ve08.2h10 TaxID=930991 RepID=A0A0D0DM11_9AGAM|nr:hypothetical protein PAXRUDRAFT_568430 [Paxillus rubicundulus Ve08.2h10]